MENPTVLLLEDEPVIAADLSALLSGFGYRVLCTSNGDEALSLCTAGLPDLVVLNFRSSDGSDGMALARTLRRMGSFKLGFITGARPADLAESPDFEAYPVLYKPFCRSQWNAFLRACGML